MWFVSQGIWHARRHARRQLLLKRLKQRVLFQRAIKHGLCLCNGLLQQLTKHLLCIRVFGQLLFDGFANTRADHVRFIARFFLGPVSWVFGFAQLMHQVHAFGLAHLGANDLLVHQLANLFLVGAVIHSLHGVAACRLTQLGEEPQIRLIAGNQGFRKTLVLEKTA